MVPPIPIGFDKFLANKKSVDKRGIFKEKHQGQTWTICPHWSRYFF